ncbi:MULTISPECIES: hypothetical protein [Bacillus]|uniref:Uncharacterized protein n=2 Tax=Bacillus TaxID=1386 RepID=A0A0M3RA61_9BACI|nr:MULTISPECIES: hypothetical protein [Bacillus]ALC82616.1 hypothetical protein AM592_14295 [Bacillus gobiensis]MBP1081550.1 hypothetical protein [Bacillus capparidis]MED1096215.1 hypothetical protein [Bacillus capparidis]
MKFYFKQREIHGQSKIITIFEDEKYISLEDILNFELISVDEIIDKVDSVMLGKSSLQEIGNERCLISVTKDGIEISDLFEGIIDDDELYPVVKLSNDEFRKFLLNWKKQKESFMYSTDNL